MCGGIRNGKNETNAFWWLGQLIQESKTKVKDDEDFKILILTMVSYLWII